MFDSEKKSDELDSSTFDIVKIDAFHNTRFWTVISFIWVWIVLTFKLAILAGDTYTCVSILVFNRWSTSDYDVYEYKVAKWIFTGCILFRFLLLAYQIAWGIHIYRTRNIALAYLNNYARLMYAVRSYDYQCLFHEIDQEGFFEWACFHVYTELDDALEVLVADLPRQVINFMTLRYYATGGELNNAILANIRSIATTNLRLSIILSFQLCTMVLFLFFFFKFLLAIILYIPIKVKIAHKGYRSLKAFCYKSVNEKVRYLVRRNHKPRTQLLNEGVMNIYEIQENPLLGSTSTFDSMSWPHHHGTVSTSRNCSGSANLSSANLFDRYSKENDIGHHPLNNMPAALYSRPQESYSMSSLRVNPFTDFESSKPRPLIPAADQIENPFDDDVGTANSRSPEFPLPVRKMTSDKLALDAVDEPMANFAPMRSNRGGSLASLNDDRVDFSSHAQAMYSSTSTPLNDELYRADPSSSASSESQDLFQRSTASLLMNNNVSYTNNRETPRDPSSKTTTNEEHTPYPVRGVSQYLGQEDV